MKVMNENTEQGFEREFYVDGHPGTVHFRLEPRDGNVRRLTITTRFDGEVMVSSETDLHVRDGMWVDRRAGRLTGATAVQFVRNEGETHWRCQLTFGWQEPAAVAFELFSDEDLAPLQKGGRP